MTHHPYTPMREFTVVLAALLLTLLLGFILGQYSLRPAIPQLVGIGCAGASGPLFAAEESDFPTCTSIERNPLS